MKIIDAAQNRPANLQKNKFLYNKKYKELLEIATKNRPDLSLDEINDMFKKIDETGCSCATLANNIGKSFLENEDEFEKNFGFSLRSSTGNIDFNRILVDIFSRLYNVAKVRIIKYERYTYKDEIEAAKTLLNKDFNSKDEAILKLFENGLAGDGFDKEGNLVFKSRIPKVFEYVGTPSDIAKRVFNKDNIKTFEELRSLCCKNNLDFEYKDLEIYQKLTGLSTNNFNFWAKYYFDTHNLDFTLVSSNIAASDFNNYEEFKNHILSLQDEGYLINVSVGPNKNVSMHTKKAFSWTKISSEKAGHIMNFKTFNQNDDIVVSSYGQEYMIPKEYISMLEFSKVNKVNMDLDYEEKRNIKM